MCHIVERFRSLNMSLFNYFEKLSAPRASTARPSAPASTATAATASEENTGSKSSDNDSESEDGANESHVDEQPSKRQKTAIRKYHDDYLLFGFISSGPAEIPLPLCILCGTSLSNSCMKPSHLSRHLKTRHPDWVGKSRAEFEHKKREMKNQSKDMKSFTGTQLSAIEASFFVAYEVAKTKKPYTIAENLIQPCVKKVVEIMLGSAAVAKIESVPLSRNTIMRRIHDMAVDVENEQMSRLKTCGHFALQFDESTDVVGEAMLIGFVRHVHEIKIVENIFCLCSLQSRTTAEEIFRAIDEEMRKFHLDWKNLISLCTDGAPAMIGVRSGLAIKVAEVANENFEATHCILHREALASESMSKELSETLHSAVKMINFIKASALNTRIFVVR